ncbi:hypothetical protein CEXT_150621 [Caerostris extrusa]|uniref:C2H2-type domain-containing protein n=1 Tax=Caerostris extrusa TaxID=172846 RepID=A0AAV4QEF6_CAEEX|nr:hypothetical protein CEXT_150621 [Caerostris extrusa]
MFSEYFEVEPVCSFALSNRRRSEDPTRRFKCLFCKYTTDFANDLRKHNLTHTGERHYKCEICGKRFVLAHHLKNMYVAFIFFNSHIP